MYIQFKPHHYNQGYMNSKLHQQRNHIQKIIVFSHFSLYTFGPQIHQILWKKKLHLFPTAYSGSPTRPNFAHLCSCKDYRQSWTITTPWFRKSTSMPHRVNFTSFANPWVELWLSGVENLGLFSSSSSSVGDVGAGDVGSSSQRGTSGQLEMLGPGAGSRQGPLQTSGSQSLNFLVLAVQHPLLDARCNVPLFRRFRTTKYPSFLSSPILAIFLRGSGSSGILANHGSSIRSHAVLCLVVSRLPGQKKLFTKWPPKDPWLIFMVNVLVGGFNQIEKY